MTAGPAFSAKPRRPLHIALDARTLNSSTGTVIARLLFHLQRIDPVNRYTIVLNRADADYWRPSAANFATTLVDAPPYSFAEQLGLRRELRRLAPDIVHFCMPQQPLFFYRRRKITTIHDLITLRIRNPHLSTPAFLAKNAIGRFAFRTAARESSLVVAVSDYTRRDVIETLGVRPDRTRVVYNAGDVTDGALEPVDLPFDRFLLYVGSHYGYKNLKRLCDVHQALAKVRPGLGLVFVGRPDRESDFTRGYCAERGYHDILFAGYLPDEQRDWLYANAAAYVFPSLAEGFGLPGLEAMGHGTPVVSSNATCLPEIYGDAVLYFDPEDVDDMTRQIARVLDDAATREALIAKGTERYRRFSWRDTAQAMLDLYEEVGAKVIG